MKKYLSALLISVLLGLSSNCQTVENGSYQEAPEHIRKIDSLFKSHFQNDLFQGGVVISQKGETIYENYLGWADRSWKIPVDKEVRFDIASVNKSMISALVLKAVEEGKLHLNDRLVDLLAGFNYQGSFHPDITIHHLMSHSSGLADYDGVSKDLQTNQFLKFKRMRFSNEAYVDFISQIEPFSEPDQTFHYSNFAYHLVAIILEETYQQPFHDILEENLTKPLGLKNTLSESKNETIIPRLAEAYTYQESTNEWMKNPFIDLSLGRRIFSTASDLNRWALVMDNPGYLSRQSLDLIKTNHLAVITKKVSYGYGWVVFDEDNQGEMGNLSISKPYIIHGGSTDGYKAMVININHGEYAISFLSNVGNRTQEMQLAEKIVNIIIP